MLRLSLASSPCRFGLQNSAFFATKSLKIEKPKRPTSAYSLYVKESAPEVTKKLIAEKGKVNPTGMLNIISKQWKALSADKRSNLEQRAERLRKTYYESKPERRPAGPMARFVQERMKSRPSQLSITEYMKELGKAWNAMPESQKLVYSNAYQRDLENYHERHPPKKSGGPRSSYSMFVKDQAANKPANVPMTSYMATIGQKWRSLEANEKQKFERMLEAAKQAAPN